MSTSDNHAPPDEPKERDADPDADRVPLRGLSPIPSPIDLSSSVPDLIRRRSKGRFFGRKRLSDRVPFEWLSLAMLILLAAIYAALKLLSPT